MWYKVQSWFVKCDISHGSKIQLLNIDLIKCTHWHIIDAYLNIFIRRAHIKLISELSETSLSMKFDKFDLLFCSVLAWICIRKIRIHIYGYFQWLGCISMVRGTNKKKRTDTVCWTDGFCLFRIAYRSDAAVCFAFATTASTSNVPLLYSIQKRGKWIWF